MWRMRESGLGATARVPGGRTRGTAGRTPRSPPEARRYLRDLRRSATATATTRVFYGHFGEAACTRASTSTSTARPGIARFRRSSAKPPTWSCATADRCPASTATARRAPSSCRACSAPELVEAFREFKRDLGPGPTHEPGQGRRPVPARSRTCASGRTTGRRQPATHFRFADDRGSFARATLRCVGVGECRRDRRRHDVPELPGDARGEALDARPGAPAVRDAATARSLAGGWRDEGSRRRSTCAWRARAARASARSTWTWRPTRPSSCRHYYEGRLRPAPGLLDGPAHARWARLASLAPGSPTPSTQTPGLARARKVTRRDAPARRDARASRRAPSGELVPARPQPRRSAEPPVLLWPDTFTDHFHPQTGIAAVGCSRRPASRSTLPSGSALLRAAALRLGMLGHARRSAHAASCGSSA